MPDLRQIVAKAYDDLVALPRERFGWWLSLLPLSIAVWAAVRGLI